VAATELLATIILYGLGAVAAIAAILVPALCIQNHLLKRATAKAVAEITGSYERTRISPFTAKECHVIVRYAPKGERLTMEKAQAIIDEHRAEAGPPRASDSIGELNWRKRRS
jgi:hypothetical protein